MAIYDTNRLPVVEKSRPDKIVAILSRSDILKERRNFIRKKFQIERTINLKKFS